MQSSLRVTVATTIGLTALAFTNPALARDGDANDFEIAVSEIGAILDGLLASTRVYVVSPSYYYYGPTTYRRSAPNGYGNRKPPGAKRRPQPAAHGLQTAPTRSKTATAGVSPVTVELDPAAKLKAAKAKAAKLGGVEKLTREDIDGLSREQLKQLRGY